MASRRAGLKVYRTRFSGPITEALAACFDGLITDARRLLPGDVAIYPKPEHWPVVDRARAEGRTVYYADNGYLAPGHWGGYFSITRNGHQVDGRADPALGQAGPERFERLRLKIKPWRRRGRHILICPPGKVFASLRGFDHQAWLDDVMATLVEHSVRPIRIRRKPLRRREKRRQLPLAADLDDAWAVVTHSSKVAIEAVLGGIPAFVTDPCAARAMASSDVGRIESPHYPAGRAEWAFNLAANQWTIEEIAAGVPRDRLRFET